ESPDLAYSIRKETGITNEDILIVGSSMDFSAAIKAALTAALELI
ncbi:MAG: hypothetical protein GX583_02465, partial [Thermoplasmatales archaeon]|nr:hypothetical protein [Thermoplasmatales archaeon]